MLSQVMRILKGECTNRAALAFLREQGQGATHVSGLPLDNCMRLDIKTVMSILDLPSSLS